MLMSHITLYIPFTLKHTMQRDLPSVEDDSGDLSNLCGCPSGTDVALIPSGDCRPSFLFMLVGSCPGLWGASHTNTVFQALGRTWGDLSQR